MKKRISVRVLLIVMGILCFLAACATYQSKVSGARDLLKHGKFDEALAKLKPLADEEGKDQLVYMMEYGTALQMAGRYKESIEVFLKADKLAEIVDYTSVSKVALATLGSEEMVQYKGENYEKLMINVSLAIDYIMIGQFDDALVEARRINEKINKIRLQGRPDYEQNPFAHYISGLLWEGSGNYDDAYISYQDAYKLDATNPFLPGDLIRLAKKSRRMDDYKKWKAEFPQTAEDSDWYDKDKGQIVVLVEQGWGPRKDFSARDRKIPKLYPVYSNTQAVHATATISGMENTALPVGSGAEHQGTSRMVYNVEKAAIQTLDADYGWLVARRLGAFAAKAVLADQIRQKNELLGVLALIGMDAADRADLRQWSTLPQTIQVVRFWVKPGDYHLRLNGVTGSGAPSGDFNEQSVVHVTAGHSVFHFWRPTD